MTHQEYETNQSELLQAIERAQRQLDADEYRYGLRRRNAGGEEHPQVHRSREALRQAEEAYERFMAQA